MRTTLQCLVVLSACSLASACSEPSSSATADKPAAKAAMPERGGGDKSAMNDKALTATAPTTIPSVAHSEEKKIAAPAPVAGDPEKQPKLDDAPTALEVGKSGDKEQKVEGEQLGFDRPLDPSEVTVKRFVLATDVKEREPIGESDVFMTDTSKIFAFVELANEGAPYAVRVHWEKVDDKPSPYGVRLDVKSAPRFRTWSWTAIKREPGRYKAVLRTLDGKDIASREFTLEPSEGCTVDEATL